MKNVSSKNAAVISILLLIFYPIMGRLLIRILPIGLGGQWIVWVILNILIAVGLVYLMQYYGSQTTVQSARKKIAKLAMTFLGFILLLTWAVIVQQYLPKPQNQESLMNNLATLDSYFRYIVLLTMCLIAPIYEEVMFRFVVIKGFNKYFSSLHLVLLSAALFSLAHLRSFSPVDFLIFFVMGLIFATLYQYTQSLYYSISLHILWNSLPYILYFLAFLLEKLS